MKSVNAALTKALMENDVMYAVPRLTAEWNMNRYFNTVVDNTPSEDTDAFDNELFPIESLTEAMRPGKGILKARIGEGRVMPDYAAGPQPARFYVASEDDTYKYWTSQMPSSNSGSLTNCAPHVIYGSKTEDDVWTYRPQTINKIVIGVENSWATPNAFTVETTTDGTSWNAVTIQSLGTSWEASGQIILYYTGSANAWTATKPTNTAPMVTTPIAGIRFTVTSLKGGIQKDGSPTTYKQQNTNGGYDNMTTDGKNSYMSLIEISGRKEVDISEYLISVDDTFDMSDVSYLYPMGTVTTNTADISLWNGDGVFSRDNPTSPYNNLLEPNVELRLDYVYTVGTTKYVVPQFKMLSDVWSNQRGDAVSVNADDYSKVFQEIIPQPALWEDLTVSEIIWRLCDSVGFTDYEIDLSDDRATDFVIPTFWADGEQNLWEIFGDLAKASQTAIFFDGNGILNIKSRQNALRDEAAPSWTLLGQKRGANLANMLDPSQTTAYEANHVTVKYQPTKWSNSNNGQPSLVKVWEPDGTQTLRASILRKTLEATDDNILIPTNDVQYWLFEGIVNIQGELMRYEGKRFTYFTGPNDSDAVTVTVKSQEERDKFNSKTPDAYQNKNHYTGALVVTERGLWNSENKRHSVDAEGYSVRRIIGGTRQVDVDGFVHLREKSKVELTSGAKFDSPQDLLIATRGNDIDSPFFHYGTRFSFSKEGANTEQRAGIVINNSGTNEDGYYIELTPTSKLTGKLGDKRNELIFYSRTNGKDEVMGHKKGESLHIGEDIEYVLDVVYTPGTTHNVSVWVNGKKFIDADVSGSNRNTGNGKFGIFTRGKTKAEFEYLYAVKKEGNIPLDDFSFLDKVERGYTSNQWDREWVYTREKRKRKGSTKNRKRFNDLFFDEFGPVVHEVREYDVKFDPMPVLHSRPYLSNDWGAALLEYNANPFGAKFIVANTSRKNAVISGDDTLSYASQNRAVAQLLNVFGRGLSIADAEEEVAKSDLQIRRRGKIESELSSKWIQTKEMAKEVAEWIRDAMSYGNENLSVEIFGNSLIEVGDVVLIDYTNKDFDNVKYFVVGVSNSFETGLSTTLTLRRVDPPVDN